MNAQLATRLTLVFVIYILLQVLVLRKFILFDYAFCFLYVGAILRMPQDISTTIMLLIGFVVGLVVDIFYNTTGMHAAACVAICFARNSIVKATFPTRGLETEISFSLKGMGIGRFAQYVLIMVLIHHIILFSIEANTTTLMWITAIKIISSVVFTSAMIILVQYLQRD
jgi:hypothetical protein